MKISYRLVIIFCSLVLLVMSIFFFSLLMGEDLFKVTAFLTIGEEGKNFKFISFLFFFLLFLLLLMAGLHTKKQLQTIIHETELGEIRVSFYAVEALALRAVKRIRGVKEAEVDVAADVDGLKFDIKVVSSPDLNIPQLIQEIRNHLKEYINDTVGIPVSNSEITIAKVTAEARARVE